MQVIQCTVDACDGCWKNKYTVRICDSLSIHANPDAYWHLSVVRDKQCLQDIVAILFIHKRVHSNLQASRYLSTNTNA